MPRLLVVEDEPHIASGLRFNLEAEGYAVDVVDSGEAAVRYVADRHDDLDGIVLDVMLPGMDGFDVATTLRSRGWFTPILMLTARGRAEDVLQGFEAGADDYLPKPFELAILVARVHALLRRHAWHATRQEVTKPSSTESSDAFEFAGKRVDFAAQQVHVAGRVLPLTLMEVNLLRYLVDRDGRVVSRREMLEDVWNLREDTDTRAIDHFIARLRKHLEDVPSQPRHLLTVRGVGYRFVSAPDSPQADPT